MAGEGPDAASEPGFIFKVLFVALVVALIAAIYTVALVFILGFASAIVAAALNNIATPLSHKLRIPHRLALVITTIGLIALLVGFLGIFGARAGERFAALAAEMPAALMRARIWLDSWGFGRWMLQLIDSIPGVGSIDNVLSALPFAGSIVTWIANAALIMVIGVYLAADANTYIDGALQLLPPSRRPRARAILHAAGDDLRKWLMAMTLDMMFLGSVMSLGLWAVGVPFPFALGAISGVSVFIPYIGPIVAIIPGLLIALSVSPQLAVYAGIVYLIGQQLEGNISSPMLQRWTVHIPPALTMLAIIGFGLLFGIWGVLLATPLAVVTMTIVRMAYVEDFLQDK